MFTPGSVPLRQLVYRVLALPPSLQPLVYDFGQLTDNTEEAYTAQIVTDHVSEIAIIRFMDIHNYYPHRF